MISKILQLTALVGLTLIFSCKSKNSSKVYQLSNDERKLCDSLQIDTSIIQEIRKTNHYSIEPFHYSLSTMSQNGHETEVDPIHLKGLVLGELNAKSDHLILNLKDSFYRKGYTIFLLANNFNINEQLDKIGVLKTTDKYLILKQIETDGINYDINNDSLLTIIKKFDIKYDIELIGASGDYCEFIIHNEPHDWMALANEVYKVCPDVVDQGAGTIKALADEMKQTKRLYFWWD